MADFPHFSDFHGDFLRWFSPTLAETLTPHAAASLPGQILHQDVSCKRVLFCILLIHIVVTGQNLRQDVSYKKDSGLPVLAMLMFVVVPEQNCSERYITKMYQTS